MVFRMVCIGHLGSLARKLDELDFKGRLMEVVEEVLGHTGAFSSPAEHFILPIVNVEAPRAQDLGVSVHLSGVARVAYPKVEIAAERLLEIVEKKLSEFAISPSTGARVQVSCVVECSFANGDHLQRAEKIAWITQEALYRTG